MAIIVLYNWEQLCFSQGKSWGWRTSWRLNTVECRCPGLLPLLRVIASNLTAEDIFLIIHFKSVYYVEILKRFGGQSPELWPTFGSSILTVYEVTVCHTVSSSLCRKVEQQSIAVLHTTLFSRQCHCSYSHYLCALFPTVHCSTIYIINTTTHSCWTCYYAVIVLQYVQYRHVANCTAKPLGFFQRFVTVPHQHVDVDMCGKFDSHIIPAINLFLFVFHLTVWQSRHVVLKNYLQNQLISRPW